MGIRQFKPVTKSSRFRSVSDFDTITRSTPEKSLVEPKPKSGGRDNHGHIAMRRIGGGHKQMYRIIDFKRNKFGVVGTVKEIEYDPNRSARIALIEYADGEKRYIIHPKGLKQGDTVVSGPGADVRNGNALPLKEVPLGTAVHCVEITPKKGAQMARSAGAQAQLLEAVLAQFRLDRLAREPVDRVVERVRAVVDLFDEPVVVLAGDLVQRREEVVWPWMLELPAREVDREDALHDFPRVHALQRMQHQRRLVVRHVLVRARPQNGRRHRNGVAVRVPPVGVHPVRVGGAGERNVAVLPRQEVAEEPLHQVVGLQRHGLHARVAELVDAFVQPAVLHLVVRHHAVPELVPGFV